jgi:hypothetical protein
MDSSPEASQNVISRTDMVDSIRKLARYGIQAVLTLGVVLLFSDFLFAGKNQARFLSEGVVVMILLGIALMVAAAIIAMTVLALWKR